MFAFASRSRILTDIRLSGIPPVLVREMVREHREVKGMAAREEIHFLSVFQREMDPVRRG